MLKELAKETEEANLILDKIKAKDLAERNAELERQADKKHRLKVVSEIQIFLIDSIGISDGHAQAITDAMQAEDMPHSQITF